MVCDTLDHYTKYFPCLKEVQQYVKEHPNQPIVLTNPFPAQQKHVIAQNTAPLPGGNPGNLPQGTRGIRMLCTINLQTCAKTYDPLEKKFHREGTLLFSSGHPFPHTKTPS